MLQAEIVETPMEIKQDSVAIKETQIMEKMTTGIMNFTSHKYELAAELFSEVSEFMALRYGETANECAEPFYYYGISLYQIALTKNDLFGASIKEPTAEDTDPQENEEENVDAKEEMGETQAASSSKIEAEPAENQGEEIQDQEEEEEEEVANDEAMDEDDLQLAWETLDMARIIYSKMDKPSQRDQINLADIYLVLADVSAEGCHWEQAIQDYQSSLKIKESVLSESNRQLAEVNYKLALAFEYNQSFEESKFHLEKSICVLKAKVNQLEYYNQIRELESNCKTEETESIKSEIEEINSLIPEMESRLEECVMNIEIRTKPETLVEKKPIHEVMKKTEIVVNDVTSLIKPKRKTDDLNLIEKKVKVEEKEEKEAEN